MIRIKNNGITVIKIFLLIFMFSIFSCSSVEKDCLNKNQKNTVIVWGSMKSDNSFKNTYKLNSNATITHTSQIKGSNVGNILDSKLSNKQVCDLFNETMGLFIKLQSLNVPADSTCFIEYINPDTKVELRALWNPEFTNKGNKEFKQLFEKLMTLTR